MKSLLRCFKACKVNLSFFCFVILCLALSQQAFSQTSFTPGNIVVYRVGSGTGPLVNTGNPVYLDEYNANSGALVQSVALPTTAWGSNKPIIADGTNVSEGMLTLSADGRYLLATGYGTTLGGSTSLSTTSSSSVPRVVAQINSACSINTTTALTDWASAGAPQTAASDGSSNVWVGGSNGGVRYTTLGATTSTQINATTGSPQAIRQLSIFNDQLYATAASSAGNVYTVATVGSFLPNGPTQAVTPLPGLSNTSTKSPYSYYMTILPAGEVLYITDNAAGTITKYSLVSGTWTSNGSISTPSIVGLTGTITSASSIVLFGTEGVGGSSGGGAIYKITDASGYNGSITGTTVSTFVTAGANTGFRGIAYAPLPVAVTVANPGNQIFNVLGVLDNLTVNGTPNSTAIAVISNSTITGLLNAIDAGVLAAGDVNLSFTPGIAGTADVQVCVYYGCVEVCTNFTITVCLLCPSLQLSTYTLPGLTTTYGTASAPATVTVKGSFLSGNVVTSTAPTGFEVSSNGSTYASTATFTPSLGTVNGTLYVRIAKTAPVLGSYNDQSITLSSSGANSVTLTTAFEGNVVSPAPLTITSVTANNKVYDGTTTATLSGTPAYVGLQNGETFSVTGTPVANFNTASVGNNKPVTVTGYTAPSTNYTVTQPTGLTANITIATPVVTVTNVGTYTYNGSAQGPNTATTGGSTGTLTFSYSGTTAAGATYGPRATPPTAAGNYTVTASVAASPDGNYAAASSSPTAFTIGKATPVVTVTNVGTYTYNGSAQGPNTATTGGSSGALTFSYSGTTDAGATYGPSATPPTAAGSYTVTASVAASADGNYTAASSSATAFTIGMATPVVTVTNVGTYTYNGSIQGPNTATAGGSSGTLTFSYSGTTDAGVTYGSSATPPTAAGNYSVTANVAASADGNYTAASSSATAFTIGMATPMVTVTNVGTYTYNGSAQGPNTATTGGSSGALTFSYSGTTDAGATYGPSSTAPTAAGSYTVTASAAASADGDYTAASSSATAFTIGMATPVVIVTNVGTYTYNGSAQGPNTATTGGSTGALSFSYSGTSNAGTTYSPSAAQPTNAGSYTVTASVAASADGNWTAASSSATAFTIGKSVPTTVTVTNVGSYTYNGNPQGPNTANTGGSTGTVSFTYSGTTDAGATYGPSSTAPTAAGNYTVTANVAASADGNYPASSSSPTSFTIGQATPVVLVTGGTTFTYNGSAQGPATASTGGSTGAVTYTYSGTTDAGATYGPSSTPPTAAGNYTVTASVAVSADGDYTAASSPATPFTIGQATPVVSVTGPTSFTYNGSAQGPATASTDGSTGAVTYTYSGTADAGATYGPSSTPPTAAGSYTVTANVAASLDGDYTAASSPATPFTIGQATPVVSVTGPTSFTYNGSAQGPATASTGGSTGAVTYTYSGTTDAGETYGPSSTPPTAAGSYTATANVAASPDGDYTAASSPATLFTIGQATPVVAVTGPTSFTYNGSAQGPATASTGGSTGTVTYTYSGITDAGATYGPSSTPPTAAGNYTVTANVAASPDGDYTAASSPATPFIIGMATPVVTVTGSTSFTYNGSVQGPATATTGGSTGALSFSYSGTTDAGATYGPGSTPPTAAGNYTVTASVAASADGDYTAASSSPTEFTISKASSSISVTGSTSYTYNGSVQGPSTYTETGSTGAVTFSYVGVSGTTYGPSAKTPENAGSYTATATVASDENYNGATSPATGFTIGMATPVVTVTGITNYTYNASPQGPNTVSDGGSTGALTYLYSGTSNTGASYSNTTPPTNAGSYSVTALVAGDANNNPAESAPYNFSINVAALSIIANNITKCNGASYSFAGTEFTATGLQGSDAVSRVSLSSAGAEASATAGAYTITIGSAVGTSLSNYTIIYTNGTMTVETALVLTVKHVNPDCYGDPGSLSGSATGGIQPYLYAVNSGKTYNTGAIVYGPATNPLYSPVTPGYYTYSVTDATGCLATASNLFVSYLTKSPVLNGVTVIQSTLPICYGATATINTTPIGGAPPYTYSYNNGAFVPSSSRYFNVPAGTYFITVKDSVGCTYNTDTIMVTQPATALSFTTNYYGQGCNNQASIAVTASGGYGGYSYSGNDGRSYQSGAVFNGLSYGRDTIIVKDQMGCPTTQWLNLIALTSSAITGNLQACFAGTTTLGTTAEGGIPPYTYSLNGGSFVSSPQRYFATVSPGSYYIIAKDSVGCTYTTGSVTVIQPSSALTFTTTTVNSNCSSSTGSITITAKGSYGGFSYSDNNGSTFQASNSFTALAPGTYNIVVKDANGCTAYNTATVGETVITTSAITGNLQICYGATTTLSTTPSGGVSPYTYSLNGGSFVQSSQRYFAEPVGSYYITVKDANGCTATTPTITVSQPSAAITFSTVQGGSVCTGNAGIVITASGGYGNYSYSDNSGSSYQASSTFSGLAAGSYPVVIKDQNGCLSATTSVRVLALSAPAITGTLTVCPGANTTISTTGTGGSAPYTYSLNGMAYVPSGSRYFSVGAGTYAITVKDNASCTYTTSPVNVTTVTCGTLPEGGGVQQKVETTAPNLTVNISPNPTLSTFHLQIQSSSREDVELIVTNMLGVKVYEGRGGVDGTYKFGAGFTNGMYILQIRQGNTIHTVKLIKGN